MIAIVGPTACGKTALSLELAQYFNGEIIAADSRTIFRDMSIGTAKPTLAEQAQVPHHLLDIVDPGTTVNVVDFKNLAGQAEQAILSRGNVPFLVGGSGMYIDAIIYDYQFPGSFDKTLRLELEALDTEELAARLQQVDPGRYEEVDLLNRHRVIRALETVGQPRSRRNTVREDILVLGVTLSKEIVRARLEMRVKKMLEEGFIDEVAHIGTVYGWDSPAFNVIGYRAFKDVIVGNKTVEEATADFVRGDLALYKKQVTWFKRNPQIHWLGNDGLSEAKRRIRDFI